MNTTVQKSWDTFYFFICCQEKEKERGAVIYWNVQTYMEIQYIKLKTEFVQF